MPRWGEYDFPALHSKLTLNELSSISIQYKNKDIYPSINATGKITVNAPVKKEDTTKKFSVPDISFENLKISREAPYVEIGSIGIAGSIKSPNMGGFEVSIEDIGSFKSDDGDGLSFTGAISLSKGSFDLAGKIVLKLFGDYAKWKFNRVEVDRIHVSYKSQPFSLEGGVWFKSGDALYGDGFRGDIHLDILEKFKFDAVAVFGENNTLAIILAFPRPSQARCAVGLSLQSFAENHYLTTITTPTYS
ncbi:MAG: hypothetical protein LBQ31_05865 [Bacteroidales bacterium]|nr:hypothetical protein [Bacteroidales bacterium]